jgi:TRAP-type mannitol/chloroaromatic compound transport system substrate-binding protein
MTITRRHFIPATAASLAAAAASPALAEQTGETVRWRLTSSFPKNLDTLFGVAQSLARIVGELTDGKFQIQTFAGGEIVPGLQVLDAVANGTVECGHTYTGYYIGKNPAFVFDGSVPFGLTPRQHYAWLFYGDGRKLMDELYDSFGVVSLPAGNTGGQMFGWFRKEIRTPKDFEGLKMRTAGFGGKVIQKLGAVPTQIAGSDIYPAMERGTIDACEWVGPYDDEKLGFAKVAKYYYTPGVMELEANNVLMVNKAAWASLPPRYQAALRYAGLSAMTDMLASYDAKNAQAIGRVVAAGAQLSVLPEPVVKALRGALEAVLDEEAAGNPQFKKILASWRKFRADQHRWFSIADTRAELAVYSTGA